VITSHLIPSVPAANRFRSRGLALAVTAGAGCALASVAEAQIVFSGTKNLTATSPSGRLDFDGNGTIDLIFSSYKGGKAPGSIGGVQFLEGSNPTGQVVLDSGGSGLIAKLAAGTPVSSASTFSTLAQGNSVGPHFTNGTGGGGLWAAGGDTGYVGFSFVSGTSTYYGWAELTEMGNPTGSTVGGTGTIFNWAYNSAAGQAINVGDTGSAVPEPATAALVAGAVVLGGALWLKRRQRSRASA
jgi:hypothetical protein